MIARRPSQKFFDLLDYTPHPIQLSIHKSKKKRRIACLGRQVGKSEAGSIEACFELFMNKGSVGWVVAPTYDQAEIIFSRVLQRVEQLVEHFPNVEVRAQARRLRLRVIHYDKPIRDSSGTRINRGAKVLGISEFRGKSADRLDNLRGATLDYVIIDEAAMMTYNVWTEAIQPMLSTKDGWALVISTPKGYNWFYDFFRLGWPGKGEVEEVHPDLPIIAPEANDEPADDFESFHSPSWEVWRGKADWYVNARKTVPDLEFRQEFGAEFISNSGSVFTGMGCIVKLGYKEVGNRWVSKEAEHGKEYVIGVDFGKNQDFSVFSVLDLATGQIVCMERTTETSWKGQIRQLKRLTLDYNDALVVCDSWGLGDVLVEDLAENDIAYQPYPIMSIKTKELVINHLNILMENSLVALPNHPAIFEELRNFQYFKAVTGTQTMRAAGRGHDDIVISLALAYYLFDGNGAFPIDIDEKDLEEPEFFRDELMPEFSFAELDYALSEANRMFR